MFVDQGFLQRGAADHNLTWDCTLNSLITSGVGVADDQSLITKSGFL